MKIRFLTLGILSTSLLVVPAAFGMDENEEFNNKRFPHQRQISSKILKKRSRHGDFTTDQKIKDICEKHKLLTELNISDSEEVIYSNRNNDEIDYLTSDIKIRKNNRVKKYDVQIKMNDDSIKEDNVNYLLFEIDGMLNDLNNKESYSSSKVKQLIKTFNTRENEQKVERSVPKKIIKNKPSLYISNLMHKFQPVDNN
jgi:hypothetical protein